LVSPASFNLSFNLKSDLSADINAIRARIILGDPGQAATVAQTDFEKAIEAAAESITDALGQSKNMLILSLLLYNAS